MAKIRKRTHLAITLCLTLILAGMELPMAGTVSKAAPAVLEAQAPELPTGDLYKMECHEVDDIVAESIPSYDSGIATYSESEPLLEKSIGDYGYNSLSAEEQAFYNALKTSYLAFITDANATFEKVTFSDNTTAFTPFGVSFTDAGIDATQAKKVHAAFQADCPWLFWVGGVSTWSDGRLLPTVKANYSGTPADVRSMNDTIENGIQTYINAVSGTEDTYEKVRIVHDKIVDTVNYAYKSDGTTPEDAYWAHSVVGVLDTKNHNTVVCEGYAKTFALILNVLDIPNVYVTGKSDGVDHAWNAVSFDGGETYYYMDATWNDQGDEDSNENTYMYFAMPKAEFETKHAPTVGGEGLHWQYDMPNLGTDMDYTYFVRYAAYAQDSTVTDSASAQQFLKGAKVLAPGANCPMLFQSDQARLNVKSALNIQSLPTYTVKEYNNMLIGINTIDNFSSITPATTFAFTESALKVSKDAETPTLEIASATANSDDYITFSSSDEAVVRVNTPYVKAKNGETAELIIKKAGTATIHAKSASGKATAACEITITDGEIQETDPTSLPTPIAPPTPSPTPSCSTSAPSSGPTETPEVTPSTVPGTSPSPSADVTEEPSASPSPGITVTEEPGTTPTAKPSIAPSANPGVTPSAIPSTTPSGNPGIVPTPTPGTTPSGNPGIVPTPTPGTAPSGNPVIVPTPAPGTTPSGSPGIVPTADPGVTPSASPSTSPSADPDATVSPIPGVTASPSPSPAGKPSATPKPAPGNKTPKKGSKVTDSKTKASYTVTGTGKNKTVEYKKSTKKSKTITIPATVKINKVTYKVTSVSAKAFAKNTSLQKITIGKNVKTIGKQAFYGCKKLKEVNMEESVTSIAREAFYNCTALTEITIPAKITKIGAFAFYNCQKMNWISIETKKLTSKSIGSDAFYRVGGKHYKKMIVEVPLSKLSSYTKMLRKKGYSTKAIIMPAGGNVEAYMPKADPVELTKDAISLTIHKSEDGTEYGTATVKVKKQKGVQIKMVTCNVKKQDIATVSVKGTSNLSLKIKAKKAGTTQVVLTIRYQKGRKIKTKKLTLDVEVATSTD